MKHVGDAGGKKIVFWQWERVALDQLIGAAIDEFPELFSSKKQADQLELFVSNGTIALVKKGTFVSANEFYPVLHDFGELQL